ncbi:hypothetical protein AAFM46_09615 [Arthrobacter sp. TMP15]|uniref:hypothetical protein n=1 Tax=Arthrobacter sp. TMP15 TaxID=3140789 RepID=UPI0031BB6AFC
MTPLNKLSTVEWAENLAALNSTAFVDLAPLQVNEKMLDAGICLGSAYTFYRGMGENNQVKGTSASQRVA